MSLYPNSLENLIEQFQKLPTIGRKSAQRLALKIVEMNETSVEAFCRALQDVKTKIHPCESCGNLTENEICSVCEDELRDHSTICVVEDTTNLIALEKGRTYDGVYHVLHGLLSPLNDVTPESINVDKLLERARDSKVKEVILAISPTVEGELTTLFLGNLLENIPHLKITRIASGIPMGSNLEYYDGVTLSKALEDRRQL